MALPNVAPRSPIPVTKHQALSTKYSPWRTLLPRHWLPFFESALDEGAVRFGPMVSGRDVVGRHSYQALLSVPTDNSGLTGSFLYRNAAFGQPLIEFAGFQDWENRGCLVDASQQCVGTLRRRIRDAGLSFTFQRPRFRTFSYASVGAGVEARDYATAPAPLLDQIDPLFRRTYYYPRVVFSTGWSNTQHPILAISAEDGVSLATTTRVRWRSLDTTKYSTSVVGTAAVYKSLDLPGFAHHVVALRGAAGAQDDRGSGYFEVGGVSGGALDILPGYVLGEGRRTFGVRGFPAASLVGIRALQGSAEYRAPLTLPGRGLGIAPLFLDRTSLTLFADAGSAWCPSTRAPRPAPSPTLCTNQEAALGTVFAGINTIASAGAELVLSAAVLSWDEPYRFRLGFAAPVMGSEYVVGEQKPTWYFTVGLPF